MIQTNAPADPKIHAAAVTLADQFTDMIAGILRPEEVGECRREAYLLARAAMENMAKGGK